jgi:hypothetical protein
MRRRSKEKRTTLRDLGDGLVLRRATRADAEALAAFNSEIHCTPGSDDTPEAISAWIRDLASGDHPTFKPGDFTIVEDTRTGDIVSSLCLISQTWAYEEVKFGVGVPELVGTKPEHRRRGLVRVQFDVVHGWSARRNHKVQAIMGIPNFYRQFGYEMALEHHGGRAGFKSDVPRLRKGEKEPFRVRRATEGDLAFIARVYRQSRQRYLIWSPRSTALWRYELRGRRAEATERRELRVIESASGDRVGFLTHWPQLWGDALGASDYELKSGVSWLAVTPTVVRYLAATGEKYAARDKKQFGSVGFWCGSEHPAYEVMAWRLPRKREPYAFYVRVADVPGFVRHIAPVLERRLTESIAVGHTGALKLSFYRDGVRIAFRKGRLVGAEAWRPGRPGEAESAAFPDLSFLHLLFGHRSLQELESSHADCFANGDEARLLLKVLFPKKASSVWPLS